MGKKLILFFLLINLFGCYSIKTQSVEDKAQNKMISTQEAISLAVNEFQKRLGKLPERFQMIVTQQDKIIKISLWDFPLSVEKREKEGLFELGGELEVKVDKEKGAIIETTIGQ